MDPNSTIQSLHMGSIIMTLFGGLALFLFGIDQMTSALKMIGGSSAKKLIARLTTNRFKAAFTGAFVTAMIQSSTATTVLVVGFISAGIMSFSQSIGIIMGANIGTTVTVQIIAFKITHYALLMISIGFALDFFFRDKGIRKFGLMLMGLGLIFFGMHLMSNATSPLQTYPPFAELMHKMANPLSAILLSAAFTALIHNSAATIGIVIVLASHGLVTLEVGIALVFGANIGTCVTALLAAIKKPPEAVRAAVVHVLINILGVLIWFKLIDSLADTIRLLSPSATHLTGLDKLAAETPRQIANAHTLFNIANTLILIWFTTPIAWLVEHIIPIRPKLPEPKLLKSLDKVLLKTPDLALDIVRKEMGRIGALASNMVRSALKKVMHGSQDELSKLERMDDAIDDLHKDIIAYLGRLSLENLTEEQSEILYDYMAATNYIENIGDTVQTNLIETGTDRLTKNVQISIATQEVLEKLHNKVCWTLDCAIEALVSNDRSLAEKVIQAKKEINLLTNNASHHLVNRLGAEEPDRLRAFRIETEMIEYLKRIYYLAKQIAKLIIEVDTTYSQKNNRHTN